jgi:hypothetical protein
MALTPPARKGVVLGEVYRGRVGTETFMRTYTVEDENGEEELRRHKVERGVFAELIWNGREWLEPTAFREWCRAVAAKTRPKTIRRPGGGR